MKAAKEIATLLVASLIVNLSHSLQATAAPPALPQIALVGTVIRSPPSPSIVLVAVDGRPQAPYLVGSTIALNWQIAAATADEILIRSRDGKTAKVRINGNAADTAAPLLMASDPVPAAEVLPPRSPSFPTPEMIEAATMEFNLPEND